MDISTVEIRADMKALLQVGEMEFLMAVLKAVLTVARLVAKLVDLMVLFLEMATVGQMGLLKVD